MASQQTLIAETIRGMKLALKRRTDDSDSDTTIQQHTNRGNKLKRKAHFVREGRLDNTGGRSYRRRIDHAGYQRYIIHQNPPRFDEDGDPVEVDVDDEEDEANGSPEEDNPFGKTKLEYLLAPLTSAAELANHPSLSIPYTTKHLTEMAENARETLQRERETLWKIKQLQQRFRGDVAWIPLERTETTHDGLLLENEGMDDLGDDRSYNESTTNLDTRVDGESLLTAAASHQENGTEQNLAKVSAQLENIHGVHAIDMAMKDIQSKAETQSALTNGHSKLNLGQPVQPDADAMLVDRADVSNKDESGTQTNGNGEQVDQQAGQNIGRDGVEPSDPSNASVPEQPSHAMTTRRKARSPTPDSQRSMSTSPVPSSIPSINNFFIPPTDSMPDRDFGLPAQEAEETRRALLLYVQKQEEVVRGTEQLLMGLLKADRRRKQVWQWCKAEGHVGELSDGEDWYDKEQWGLATDLIKGKEEEDVEDEGVRKGRRRRDPKKTTQGA